MDSNHFIQIYHGKVVDKKIGARNKFDVHESDEHHRKHSLCFLMAEEGRGQERSFWIWLRTSQLLEHLGLLLLQWPSHWKIISNHCNTSNIYYMGEEG